MRTSQVIQQAQNHAANAQKPFIVYFDGVGGGFLEKGCLYFLRPQTSGEPFQWMH